ncbi:CPBP family glutamic-type intramembrane protease [Micromonospora chersina]|uniref:CPBP family glutamic-type intramembrane protease n=1 Tax=Micromonospora chersina TaxID=47854 RepID=UPI0036B8B577
MAIPHPVFGDFSRLSGAMWSRLIIGSILVGFNEEVIARGQFFVALRTRFGEVGVWLLSTLLFSLLHLPNFSSGSARSQFCGCSSSSARLFPHALTRVRSEPPGPALQRRPEAAPNHLGRRSASAPSGWIHGRWPGPESS